MRFVHVCHLSYGEVRCVYCGPLRRPFECVPSLLLEPYNMRAQDCGLVSPLPMHVFWGGSCMCAIFLIGGLDVSTVGHFDAP